MFSCWFKTAVWQASKGFKATQQWVEACKSDFGSVAVAGTVPSECFFFGFQECRLALKGLKATQQRVEACNIALASVATPLRSFAWASNVPSECFLGGSRLPFGSPQMIKGSAAVGRNVFLQVQDCRLAGLTRLQGYGGSRLPFGSLLQKRVGGTPCASPFSILK